MGSFTYFVIQLLFCRTPIGAAALILCNTNVILPGEITNKLRHSETFQYLYYKYTAAFPGNAGICITHKLQMESEVIRWPIYQYVLTVAVTCCTYIQRTLIFAIPVVILSEATVLRILVIWIFYISNNREKF